MSLTLRDEMTDAERAVVAKGHCEYCGDYVDPKAKRRHRGLCAFAQALAKQREREEHD